MAHFAEIGLNNKVLRVVVINNNEMINHNLEPPAEDENIGAEFCRNLFGGTWVQTSYNGNIRKNFAGVGYTYDSERDAFIPLQPFNSWVLNENTCLWEAPVAMPNDNKKYYWNEETLSWLVDDSEQPAAEPAA